MLPFGKIPPVYRNTVFSAIIVAYNSHILQFLRKYFILGSVNPDIGAAVRTHHEPQLPLHPYPEHYFMKEENYFEHKPNDVSSI